MVCVPKGNRQKIGNNVFILYSEVFGRLFVTEWLHQNKLLIDPLLIDELCIAIFSRYLCILEMGLLHILTKRSNGHILALIQIACFTSEESHF